MKATLIYFKILIFSSLLGSLNFILPIPSNFFGFNLSGYSWILVLVVSVYYILFVVKRSYFSIKIWFPWLIYLFIYLLLDFSFVGLQGTIQFIVPILVGYTVGGLKYNKNSIAEILKYFKYLVIVTILSTSVFSFIRLGFFGFGPATDAHIAAISGVLSFSFYYHTKKIKFLFYYGCALVIPILAVTRMGILIMLLIPFVHFYKIISTKKLLLIFIMIPVSIYIFNLPAIQKKMFFEGNGNISDIYYGSNVLNTSGRSLINEVLVKEFYKRPVFGNGPRADYFIFKSKNWTVTEAHNEYLQITVCYGLFGFLLFILTLLIQLMKIKSLRTYSVNEKIIRATFFTLFIPLFLFMGTDTIIRLTYSFMNYFFVLMGLLMTFNNQNLKINKYNNDNNSSYPFI
jgi:hypothetical protein